MLQTMCPNPFDDIDKCRYIDKYRDSMFYNLKVN